MNTAQPTMPYAPEELATPWAAAYRRSRAQPGEFNPTEGAVNPGNPAHPSNSLTYQLGSMLRSGLTSGPGRAARRLATVPFNHGAGLGAVSGVVGGGALGYGLGRLFDRLSDEEDDGVRPWLGGAVGALAGGVGGHLLGAMREKAANMLSARGDDKTYVWSRLAEDHGLSPAERQALRQAVSRLDESDLSDLSEALRMAGGAAVGVLVAKFLMKAGLGGMLLGGLTGGFVGARLGGPSILGTAHYSGKTDAYGNNYTF